METFRKVPVILAVIPLALLVDNLFIHPNNYAEDSVYLMAYQVLDIPILVLNYWAWFDPEIIEFYLFDKELK